MAAELVNSATSDKLREMDWTKNIQICELVAHDNRQARNVIKAIKKRLGSKNSDVQLYAVMLLEMLMNNIGEQIHKQVIDVGVLHSLVKIVKKKSDLPVRERIFLLLDATQTSLGGASGKFPQYYTAYYDLVSAGIQFPQRPRTVPSKSQVPEPATNSLPKREERVAPRVEPRVVPGILQRASNALEVLKDVLDAVDNQHPEGAKDEFTLDLVEQCSFQKQKVLHLVATSRNAKVVSQGIELNEKLQEVLTRHFSLLSCKPTPTVNHLIKQVEEEEEEPEQLVQRLRKGKACIRPEDEEQSVDRRHLSLFGLSNPGERLNRPLIRPRSLKSSSESNGHHSPVAIPPPPAKHVERERFFRKNKVDGSSLAGHVRGLSLHSRNASSSFSGSMYSSEEKLDEIVEQRHALGASRRGEALEEARKKRGKIEELSGNPDVNRVLGLTCAGKASANGNRMKKNGDIVKKRNGVILSNREDHELDKSESKQLDTVSKLNGKVKVSLNNGKDLSDKEAMKLQTDYGKEIRGKSKKELREYYNLEMENLFVRADSLGQDRNHNRYWWFQQDGRVFVESSDSKQWGYYSTIEEINLLMGSLNCKGKRERELKNQMEKIYICALPFNFVCK